MKIEKIKLEHSLGPGSYHRQYGFNFSSLTTLDYCLEANLSIKPLLWTSHLNVSVRQTRRVIKFEGSVGKLLFSSVQLQNKLIHSKQQMHSQFYFSFIDTFIEIKTSIIPSKIHCFNDNNRLLHLALWNGRSQKILKPGCRTKTNQKAFCNMMTYFRKWIRLPVYQSQIVCCRKCRKNHNF